MRFINEFLSTHLLLSIVILLKMCCKLFERSDLTLWQVVLRQPRNGVTFGFLPLVNIIPRERAGVSPVVGVIPGEEWEILKQYIMSNCIVTCQDCLVQCKY